MYACMCAKLFQSCPTLCDPEDCSLPCIYTYICVCVSVCIYIYIYKTIHQISSVALLYPTVCDPMNCSMPGFPVHHQLPDLAQTHVYQVSDAIQPSHPLPSPFPAFNLAQHRGLFQ